MAKRPFLLRDRRPGWPPGRSDHTNFAHQMWDEIVLLVLWAMVLAALVGLVFLLASLMSGWGGFFGSGESQVETASRWGIALPFTPIDSIET